MKRVYAYAILGLLVAVCAITFNGCKKIKRGVIELMKVDGPLGDEIIYYYAALLEDNEHVDLGNMESGVPYHPSGGYDSDYYVYW